MAHRDYRSGRCCGFSGETANWASGLDTQIKIQVCMTDVSYEEANMVQQLRQSVVFCETGHPAALYGFMDILATVIASDWAGYLEM